MPVTPTYGATRDVYGAPAGTYGNLSGRIIPTDVEQFVAAVSITDGDELLEASGPHVLDPGNAHRP